MEIYAGMISNMDYHVGRTVKFPKDIGEYENTIVIFMSDNGSNALTNAQYSPGEPGKRFLAQFDNSVENLGRPGSHYAYGPGWGSACSGPFDYFKAAVGEGGIRSPLIITGPGVKPDQRVDAFSYVTDILPTVLEMAGIQHPEQYKGKKVEAVRGRSIRGLLSGEQTEVYSEQDFVGGEMWNGKWMRQGRHKAVAVAPPYGGGVWQLFDLSADPGETHDLAAEKPELLKTLIAAWDRYAEEVGVVLANR